MITYTPIKRAALKQFVAFLIRQHGGLCQASDAIKMHNAQLSRLNLTPNQRMKWASEKTIKTLVKAAQQYPDKEPSRIFLHEFQTELTCSQSTPSPQDPSATEAKPAERELEAIVTLDQQGCLNICIQLPLIRTPSTLSLNLS